MSCVNNSSRVTIEACRLMSFLRSAALFFFVENSFYSFDYWSSWRWRYHKPCKHQIPDSKGSSLFVWCFAILVRRISSSTAYSFAASTTTSLWFWLLQDRGCSADIYFSMICFFIGSGSNGFPQTDRDLQPELVRNPLLHFEATCCFIITFARMPPKQKRFTRPP